MALTGCWDRRPVLEIALGKGMRSDGDARDYLEETCPLYSGYDPKELAKRSLGRAKRRGRRTKPVKLAASP